MHGGRELVREENEVVDNGQTRHTQMDSNVAESQLDRGVVSRGLQSYLPPEATGIAKAASIYVTSITSRGADVTTRNSQNRKRRS